MTTTRVGKQCKVHFIKCQKAGAKSTIWVFD